MKAAILTIFYLNKEIISDTDIDISSILVQPEYKFSVSTLQLPKQMFALLFDLEDYATTYRATRDAYLKAANELKLATGPYKAARDAYVAATATYTKSLYE